MLALKIFLFTRHINWFVNNLMQKNITGQNRPEGDQEGICRESVVLCH